MSNMRADIGVAIVAPGGYAPDETALVRAVERLQAQGCRVHNYYDPGRKHQRFGGTDDSRIAQIHAAARNPDVQIVLASSGKLFVGHSDFTALQMGLLAQQGGTSFAGPMICDDFTREELSSYTLQQFWQCVNDPSHTVGFHADDNPALDVSGILWGGNLTMLTHLAGTPYMPRIDGGILFVEDVNEHPYRVERMLLQLLHAGLLNQKALLLGDFSNYRLSAYDNGYDFAAMLAYLRARLHIPVLTGLPFGHVRDKTTLVVSCQARLTCGGGGATLMMSGYPALSGAS